MKTMNKADFLYIQNYQYFNQNKKTKKIKYDFIILIRK